MANPRLPTPGDRTRLTPKPIPVGRLGTVGADKSTSIREQMKSLPPKPKADIRRNIAMPVDPSRSTGGRTATDARKLNLVKQRQAAVAKAVGSGTSKTRTLMPKPAVINDAKMDFRQGAKPGSGVEEPQPIRRKMDSPDRMDFRQGAKPGSGVEEMQPIRRKIDIPDRMTAGQGAKPGSGVEEFRPISPTKRTNSPGKAYGKSRTNLNSQGKATARKAPFKTKEVRMAPNKVEAPNPKAALARKRKTTKRGGLKGMPPKKGG